MLDPAAMRPATAPRPLSGLAALLGLCYTGPATVTGVTHDSRRVRPGDVYVALPGSRAHGAEFVEEAARAGAAAVLTDPEGHRRAEGAGVPVLTVADPRAVLGRAAAWVYAQPATSLLLLGVTGTSGKTTVTYLLERGLAVAGHHTGLVGTVQTRVGDDVAPSAHTTPEASDLQALFAVMRERGVTAAAVEVSSHGLALGRAGATVYDVAVFTNLSPEHLDFHRDLEDYFTTKARLFTPAHSKLGVINMDDAYGRRLAGQAQVPVSTFSAAGRPDADWRAEQVRWGAGGSVFQISGPGGISADASVALPGHYNVANALGAVVALVEAGLPLQTAVLGVSSVSSVPGRMERVDAGQDFLALVDYSHKPGAVEAMLTALRPLTGENVIVVLGCGGDRDRAKRPLMGAAAARLADIAVFTDDNPRSEDSLAILSAMLAGAAGLTEAGRRRAHVVVEPDRAAAISLAVSRAGPGDVLVVAGKGHEQGQQVVTAVHPFDDRTVLRASLQRRLEGRLAGGVEDGVKGGGA